MGPTSHDVVRAVRRTFGLRAAGHTGTLDPFATGLLVVLLGRATRLARFVEAEAKTYLATAQLGQATLTDDATGEPDGPPFTGPVPGEAAIRAAFEGLRGTHPQRPPAYSAKKVGGVRSYALARRGEAPALAPVPVTVHALDVLEAEWPRVTFRCTVSAGTYVRALARDAGRVLGTGAHLVALRREAIGRLDVADAVPLAALSRESPVRTPAEVLAHLPRVALDAAAHDAVAHGRPLPNGWAVQGTVALLDGEALVAVAQADDAWVRPVVVLEGA